MVESMRQWSLVNAKLTLITLLGVFMEISANFCTNFKLSFLIYVRRHFAAPRSRGQQGLAWQALLIGPMFLNDVGEFLHQSGLAMACQLKRVKLIGR